MLFIIHIEDDKEGEKYESDKRRKYIKELYRKTIIE
jgi:hypothetical protein